MKRKPPASQTAPAIASRVPVKFPSRNLWFSAFLGAVRNCWALNAIRWRWWAFVSVALWPLLPLFLWHHNPWGTPSESTLSLPWSWRVWIFILPALGPWGLPACVIACSVTETNTDTMNVDDSSFSKTNFCICGRSLCTCELFPCDLTAKETVWADGRHHHERLHVRVRFVLEQRVDWWQLRFPIASSSGGRRNLQSFDWLGFSGCWLFICVVQSWFSDETLTVFLRWHRQTVVVRVIQCQSLHSLCIAWQSSCARYAPYVWTRKKKTGLKASCVHDRSVCLQTFLSV